MKMVLYYDPRSQDCRDAKWFAEVLGLKVKIVDVTNQKGCSKDIFLKALTKEKGIMKLPALEVVGERVYFGGYQAIRRLLVEAAKRGLEGKSKKKHKGRF